MRRWIGAAALALLVAGQAQAEIYKCQENGSTVFQDQPCAGSGGQYAPTAPVSSMSAPKAEPSESQQATAQWLQERAERQKAQAQRRRASQNEQARINDAYENGQVTKGMTQEQVRDLWGEPWESLVEYGESDDRCVTWYYGGAARAERPEVTFCDGIATRLRAYGR